MLDFLTKSYMKQIMPLRLDHIFASWVALMRIEGYLLLSQVNGSIFPFKSHKNQSDFT